MTEETEDYERLVYSSIEDCDPQDLKKMLEEEREKQDGVTN